MKKMLVVLAAAVLALALAGCSGGGAAAKNLEVGEQITMGTFKDADLSWTVMKVDGDKALIVCDDELKRRMAFDENMEKTLEDNGAVSWEKSTIRTYLNGEFLKGFSEEEQGKIQETAVTTPAGPSNLAGGADTTDKVFLLSMQEAEELYPEDEARADLNGGWYYLRTAGGNNQCMVVVFGDGGFHEFGFGVDAPGGIRPAMWISAAK